MDIKDKPDNDHQERESIQFIQSSQIKNLSLFVHSIQTELKEMKQQKILRLESPQKHQINDNESNIDHQCSSKIIQTFTDYNDNQLFYRCLSYLYKLLINQNIDVDITNIDGFETSSIPDSIKTVFSEIHSVIISEKAKVSALNLEKENIRVQLNEFQIENEEMRNLLKKCRKNIKIYKQEEEIKISDYNKIIDQLKKKLLEKDELIHRFELKQDEMIEKDEMIDRLSKEKEESLKTIKSLEEINNELQKSMNKQCEEWDNLANSLKQKFAKDNKMLLNKHENLENEFEKLKTQNYELTTKLQESQFENVKQCNTMNTLNEELQVYVSKMKELIEKNTVTEYELDGYKEEINELKPKLNEFENKHKLLMNDIQHYKEMDLEKDSKINKLETEIKYFKSKWNKMDESQLNILKQVESLQHQYQQKQQETNDLQNQNNKLLSEMNKYKQEVILLANDHQFVCDNLEFEKQRNKQFEVELNKTRDELQKLSERLHENKQNYELKLLESDKKYKNQERYYNNITKMYKQLKGDISKIRNAKK